MDGEGKIVFAVDPSSMGSLNKEGSTITVTPSIKDGRIVVQDALE